MRNWYVFTHVMHFHAIILTLLLNVLLSFDVPSRSFEMNWNESVFFSSSHFFLKFFYSLFGNFGLPNRNIAHRRYRFSILIMFHFKCEINIFHVYLLFIYLFIFFISSSFFFSEKGEQQSNQIEIVCLIRLKIDDISI